MSVFRRHSLALLVLSLGALAPAALAGCGSTHTTEDMIDAGPIIFDLDGATLPDTPLVDAARPSGNVGAACSSPAECTGAADVCIPDQPGFLPGGYCTSACMPTDPDSCPTGSTCIEVGMGQAFCFQECDPAATARECRAGYGCADNFMALPANVCVGGCFDPSDCAAGQMCDRTGGALGAGACYDPAATLGGACETDGDCPMGGTCQDEAAGGWPGGACIAGGCDVETNMGCDAGAQCIPGGFGGVCVEGCATDGDCRAEYACRPSPTYPDRTYCAPACASDSECTVAGYVCNTTLGTCAPPFDDARLGQSCSFREPCEGGTCFGERDSGYPSGYCAYVGCELGVSGSCPGDGVCATRGTRNLCFDGCATDGDCRTGYACRPSNPADATSPLGCLPACASEDECPGRSTGCNLGTGLCLQEFDPGQLGNECTSVAECVGGVCLSEASAGWPAGTCAFPGCRLSGSGPSSDCPMGSVCVDDGAGDPAIGACVTGCGAGTTCRTGYACVEGACRPACTDTSCGAGRTCEMASGLCR
jgi:hypothetical protein